MAYTLPPLPYPNNALEPHIDAKTMEIHHGKHHNAYVTNLNKALEGKGLPSRASKICAATSKRFRKISARPCATTAAATPIIRCSGLIMSPKGGGKPGGDLAKAIDSELGGFDKFKEQFTNAGDHAVRQRLGLAERRQVRQARRSKARRIRTTRT